MLRVIYFLLFFVMLVYPHGLLEGTYLNYLYFVVTFLCFLFFDKKNKIKLGQANKFLLHLFVIVLIGNSISAFIKPNISIVSYVSSTLRYLTFFLISTIILSTTNNKKQFFFWMYSFFSAYTLSLIILFLDASKVGWIEEIFKVTTFDDLNTLDIYFRAYGSYLSPVSAGIFLLNTFILLIVALLSQKFLNSKQKFFLLILSIATLIGVVVTASRTSMVGLAVAIICFLFFTKEKGKILLVVGAIILLSLQFNYLDSFIENILIRTQNETSYNTSYLEGAGRVATMQNSIRLFFNERTFLTGVGPSEYDIGDESFSLAHNGFLSILLCYGLTGTFLFAKCFFCLYGKIKIRNVNSIHKNHSLEKVLFTVFLIVNAFTFISSDGPVTTFWLYYLIFFLVILNRSFLLNSSTK